MGVRRIIQYNRFSDIVYFFHAEKKPNAQKKDGEAVCLLIFLVESPTFCHLE